MYNIETPIYNNNTLVNTIEFISGDLTKYKHDSFVVQISCLIMLLTPLYILLKKKNYIWAISGFIMAIISFSSDTNFCLYDRLTKRIFVTLDVLCIILYIIISIYFIINEYRYGYLFIIFIIYFLLCSNLMLNYTKYSSNKTIWEKRHSIWHLFVATLNFIVVYMLSFTFFQKNIIYDIILIICIIINIICLYLFQNKLI